MLGKILTFSFVLLAIFLFGSRCFSYGGDTVVHPKRMIRTPDGKWIFVKRGVLLSESGLGGERVGAYPVLTKYNPSGSLDRTFFDKGTLIVHFDDFNEIKLRHIDFDALGNLWIFGEAIKEIPKGAFDAELMSMDEDDERFSGYETQRRKGSRKSNRFFSLKISAKGVVGKPTFLDVLGRPSGLRRGEKWIQTTGQEKMVGALLRPNGKYFIFIADDRQLNKHKRIDVFSFNSKGELDAQFGSHGYAAVRGIQDFASAAFWRNELYLVGSDEPYEEYQIFKFDREGNPSCLLKWSLIDASNGESMIANMNAGVLIRPEMSTLSFFYSEDPLEMPSMEEARLYERRISWKDKSETNHAVTDLGLLDRDSWNLMRTQVHYENGELIVCESPCNPKERVDWEVNARLVLSRLEHPQLKLRRRTVLKNVMMPWTDGDGICTDILRSIEKFAQRKSKEF